MNSKSDPHPRQRRYRARLQARLDAETHAKLEELTAAFHRKGSAILRHMLSWGLTQAQGWTFDRGFTTTVHLVPILLEPALLQQVQDSARVHGTTVAVWVRHCDASGDPR